MHKKGKKLAIVIGASNESIYAIQSAKNLGLTVYAFDGNENAQGLQYADKAFVVDIRDYKNVVKELKDEKPNIVLPVPIGRCLVTSGQLNDYYQIKGISAEVCEKSVDKFLFHEILAKKNLRNCDCYLFNNKGSKIPSKFPVVFKPRFGSASRDVFVLNNEKEFFKIINSLKPIKEDFVCESFFEGQEYGIDGLVINKNLYTVLIRRKEITKLPYRQCIGYYSVMENKNKELYTRINKYLEQIVKALGINNAVFHADIIDNGQESFIIELSPRPSGHNLHNLFTKVATGIDMIDLFIKSILNDEIKLDSIRPNVKPTLISYFNFEKCRIKKIPNKEYLFEKYPLLAYVCNISENDYMETIKNGKILMTRGYYILQADNDVKLNEYRNNLLNEFEVLYEE